MDNRQFRALMELAMCCDHWPVEDKGENQAIIVGMLDKIAKGAGHFSWINAYYELGPNTPTFLQDSIFPSRLHEADEIGNHSIGDNALNKHPLNIDFVLIEPEKPRFTAWYGGLCPEDAKYVRVEVLFKSGRTERFSRGVTSFWVPVNSPSDVIAYRIL